MINLENTYLHQVYLMEVENCLRGYDPERFEHENGETVPPEKRPAKYQGYQGSFEDWQEGGQFHELPTP